MKPTISALALCATAALAWGGIPDLPATYAVKETTQLGMAVSAMGRTKSQTRTSRSNGTLEIHEDRTLRFTDPKGFFMDSEATWTEAGRNGLRFVLTGESKDEIETLLEDVFSAYGLSGSATGQFSAGRLAFQRQGSRVTGNQVSKVNVKGRYRGRRFALWITARMSWAGRRTD